MPNRRLINTTTPTADAVTDAVIEALRALDPDLPDRLWKVITGYSPNRTNSDWPQVRPFVIECVLRMKPRSFSNARRLMTMTALYVSWAWAVTGCDLTGERVFVDALVHRYLASKLKKHSAMYRFDTARQLSAISETLTGKPTSRLRTPFQSPRVAPYSSAQVASLYSWANTLSTPLKRQNARALLGLAGGAGLTAQDLMDVQVEDIEFRDGRVFVNVHGDRPRRVPVRANWARTLTKSVGDRASGNMVSGYRLEEYPPNALQQFLSDNPCTPRPSAARLHSGWVVTQLDAGLPLQILLEITGFTSVQSFQHYLKYTREHRLNDHLGRIIGEEVA